MTGISRKLPDTERARLKAILKRSSPEDAGVIVRTAAEGASEEDARPATSSGSRRSGRSSRPKPTDRRPRRACCTASPTWPIRVVRDVFNEDFNALVVAGRRRVGHDRRLRRAGSPPTWPTGSRSAGPRTPTCSTTYRVDEQLAKALDRKVWLPCGGSLVIDRTEAMTVVDVNTGKFIGKGGNLEETVTKNNLEAAEEIVRQLRLRDVGGIIVIDFIDMVLETNRDLVLRRLIECLGRDRTKHQVAEVTSLGLVQMTRKRVGEGLLESFSETCEVCGGRGVIAAHRPASPRSGRRSRPPVAGAAEAGQAGEARRLGGGRLARMAIRHRRMTRWRPAPAASGRDGAAREAGQGRRGATNQ